MKTMKKMIFAGISLFSVAVLAACQAKENTKETELSFATEVTHEGEAIKGGQLNYAVVSPRQQQEYYWMN